MATAAHTCLFTSLFLLTFSSLIPVVLPLSFDYPAVGQQLFPSPLRYYGNVSVQSNSVQLTYHDANSQSQVGRVFYSDPLPFWSTSTGQEASFNCSFSFQITNIDPGNYGDGLAFLLVDPSLADIPNNTTGGSLGLVPVAKDGNASNKLVAVEFDTFLNPTLSDPNGNHIGVDVNSVISATNVSELGFDMKTSSEVYAWIDYNSSEKSLVVYATNTSDSKPDVALLSYPVNLSQYLPSSVLIGFSAATGASSEIHTLMSWSFNSTDVDTASNKPSIGLIVGIIIGVLVLAGVIPVILLIRRKCRRGQKSARESDSMELSPWTAGPKMFTYKQLSVATKNFSSSQQLGQGGFGSVYKGIVPEDGSEVAVKRVSQTSKQGEKEFRAEVTIISRIRHRNLVELKGWCHEKGNLLLVYEYLPNRSLDFHLFDKGENVLDWSTRYRIVCELGSALQYLHEECAKVIIHRDVKASNVMLDARFNAKLGDFGLARELMEGTNAYSTILAGTRGYMAPESYVTGKATTESDVFSFGAVLLEVACGRRPTDLALGPAFDGLLVNWVWSLYGKGQLLEAVDEKLEGEFDEVELTRTLILGLACSHPDAKSRPSIRQAVEVLQGRAHLPPLPTSKPVPYYGPRPAFTMEDLFSHSGVLISQTSSSSIIESAPATSISTASSSITESTEQSFLRSIG